MLILFAANADALPQKPDASFFVTDEAGVLNPDHRSKLIQLLTQFERMTQIEIAVVTASDLNNTPIDMVATELVEKWGIGKKGKDNGILFLIAPNERKVRIEVGYGLEGVLPDAKTGTLLASNVLPYFKKGQFSLGILAGTVSIINAITGKEMPGIALNSHASKGAKSNTLIKDPGKRSKTIQQPKRSLFSIIKTIILIIVGLYLFIRHPRLFLLMLLMGGGRGSGRSGGFGGGFGGFGGGLSGGGGASRGW